MKIAENAHAAKTSHALEAAELKNRLAFIVSVLGKKRRDIQAIIR